MLAAKRVTRLIMVEGAQFDHLERYSVMTIFTDLPELSVVGVPMTRDAILKLPPGELRKGLPISCLRHMAPRARDFFVRSRKNKPGNMMIKPGSRFERVFTVTR